MNKPLALLADGRTLKIEMQKQSRKKLGEVAAHHLGWRGLNNVFGTLNDFGKRK